MVVQAGERADGQTPVSIPGDKQDRHRAPRQTHSSSNTQHRPHTQKPGSSSGGEGRDTQGQNWPQGQNVSRDPPPLFNCESNRGNRSLRCPGQSALDTWTLQLPGSQTPRASEGRAPIELWTAAPGDSAAVVSASQWLSASGVFTATPALERGRIYSHPDVRHAFGWVPPLCDIPSWKQESSILLPPCTSLTGGREEQLQADLRALRDVG